jgi:predicted Mrr-cat superfamily restriction endonuclease
VANEELRDRLASRLTFKRKRSTRSTATSGRARCSVRTLGSWGGLTTQALDALKTSRLQVRVWEAADVVDVVLANYEQLPEEIKTASRLST